MKIHMSEPKTSHGFLIGALISPVLYALILWSWVVLSHASTEGDLALEPIRKFAGGRGFALFYISAVLCVAAFIGQRIFLTTRHKAGTFLAGWLLLVGISLSMGWVSEIALHGRGFFLSASIVLAEMMSVAYAALFLIFVLILFLARKHARLEDE